jgi:hypothetical protein
MKAVCDTFRFKRITPNTESETTLLEVSGSNFARYTNQPVALGGLVVSVLARFAGSIPAEVDGFLRVIKILLRRGSKAVGPMS